MRNQESWDSIKLTEQRVCIICLCVVAFSLRLFSLKLSSEVAAVHVIWSPLPQISALPEKSVFCLPGIGVLA